MFLADTSEYVLDGSSSDVLSPTAKGIMISIIVATFVAIVLIEVFSEKSRPILEGFICVPAFFCWLVFWGDSPVIDHISGPLLLLPLLGGLAIYLFIALVLAHAIKWRRDRPHGENEGETINAGGSSTTSVSGIIPNSTHDGPSSGHITKDKRSKETLRPLDNFKNYSTSNDTPSVNRGSVVGQRDILFVESNYAESPRIRPQQTLHYCFRCGGSLQTETCSRCGHHHSGKPVQLLNEIDPSFLIVEKDSI